MATGKSSDLFQDKAAEWDSRPIPARISEGVGAALRANVMLSSELRVMDFGAGTGLVAAQVVPHVKTLHAVDISEAMLDRLAEKPELKGRVQIHCQDILVHPLETRVDLIVSAMAMHHVQNTSALIQAFAEHLEPGGKLALADLDAEDGSFHPEGIEGVFHHGFDRAQLRQILEQSDFVDVEFTTALEVERDDRRYPIFLLTATKAR